jgi:hypothetical protein
MKFIVKLNSKISHLLERSDPMPLPPFAVLGRAFKGDYLNGPPRLPTRRPAVEEVVALPPPTID